ncbi:MAG: holin, BlyA family protein [Blautia sp.]|nr:holin, BlyA family protein [Blautia sp.]
MNEVKTVFRDFLEDEEAAGVVEIILVLIVLIGLVVIFKDQLTSLVETLLAKVTSQSAGI